MSDGRIAAAHERLIEAVEQLRAAVARADDTDQITVLVAAEAARRRLDHLSVVTLATLERRDVFTDRGYRSSASALADLLGWERGEARRHATAAENVVATTALDGATLPPRLPATAEMFDAGRTSVRHVEVIAKVLATRAAGRLAPQVWAAAETELAAHADQYTPTELHAWGTALIEQLDQDGPEPDDRPDPEINELRLTRHRDRPRGKILGSRRDAVGATRGPSGPAGTAPPCGPRRAGTTLTDAEHAAITEAVLSLPPMSDDQIRRVCEVINAVRARHARPPDTR